MATRQSPPYLRTSRPKIPSWLTVIGLLLLVTFGRVPGETNLWGTLQNSGHAPAFFLVTVSILYLLFLKDPVRDRRAATRYIGTFLFCLLAGILVEWIQSVTGRRMSLDDIGADTLGIACGMAGFAWYRGRGAAGRARQAILLSICLVSAGIAVAPLAWSIAAYWNRNGQFPVIADFNAPTDLYFVSSFGSATSLVTRPDGSRALHVTLHPDENEAWPGIGLYEPVPDWTGYQMLLVDLTNPGDQTLRLTLRVHDRRHNQRLDDRFNQSFVLLPREHTVVRFPLSAIRTAPTIRDMDMGAITGLVLFGSSTLEGREFILGKAWLE